MKKNDSNKYSFYNEQVADLKELRESLVSQNELFFAFNKSWHDLSDPRVVSSSCFSCQLLLTSTNRDISHISPRLASKSVFSDYLPVILDLLTRVRHF